MTYEEASKNFFNSLTFDQKPSIIILPDREKLKIPVSKIKADDVKQWLQKNIDPFTPHKNNVIKKILNNANFDKMYVEVLHEHEKENFIIVPLKKSNFSQHPDTKSQLPLEYLLLVENANGYIRRGDIGLFYPRDRNLKKLPEKSFYNFFNSDFSSVDGTFTLITLGNVKLWEMDFKDRQKTELRSLSAVRNNQTGSHCNEWYLETIKYFNWQIKLSRKYLGNTCTGCPPGQKCDPER